MWPNSFKGSISLTFDDGMDSHLKFAAPQLDKRGIKATFYLNPGGAYDNQDNLQDWERKLIPWKPIAEAGHEIGNHTIRHPCSLNVNLNWQKDNNLLDWTLEKIESDIVEAKKRIHSAFPGQLRTSFAYPCYESTVKRGINRKSYTPIVAEHFVAGRARGELRGELANDPIFCDLHHLSSWAVERQTGAFLIGLVEQAIALNRWGIFTFHGIQEGHLPIGDSDFVELLNHLERRKDSIWIAPVATIAGYIKDNIQVS